MQGNTPRLVLAVGFLALLLATTLGQTAFVPPPRQAPADATAWNLAAGAGALATGLGLAESVAAQELAEQDLTPENFRPVCPASDGLYGFGKAAADGLLGSEGAEYRPLAIEALLRVRLEVCVLESFVYEAVVPFVQRKGLGWILPLHETIDTVIAGTVFAVAVNFILFGTTKILSVLGIYHDFLIGAPLRLIGFAILPEQKPKETPFIQINWPGTQQKTEEVEEESEPPPPPAGPIAVFGGICKGYGIFAGILKDFLEGVDTFAGRYLAFFSATDTNALDALIAAAGVPVKSETPKKTLQPSSKAQAVKMEPVKTEPPPVKAEEEDDDTEEEDDPLMGAALKAARVKPEMD